MRKTFVVVGGMILGLLLLGIGLREVIISSQKTANVSDISQTVLNFYHNYQDCMQNPPAEAFGQVSTYCQSHNPNGGLNLVENLEKGGVAKAGADPIFCSQNPSPNFSVKDPIMNGDQGSATVVFNYGPEIVTNITVNLTQGVGVWKISNIVCPSP